MKLENIKRIIATNDKCSTFNSKEVYVEIFKLLDYEISNFDFYKEKEYDYLMNIFNILKQSPKNLKVQKDIHNNLESVRSKVKELISKNKQFKNTFNYNYNFLKDFISQIEIYSLSILYDYIDKFEGPKDKFFNFLIFDVKNYAIIDDVFSRFPHLFDFSDENNYLLLENLIDNYLDCLEDYVYDLKPSKLNNLIYYGDILEKILKSSKLKLDIEKRRELLRKITARIKNNKKSDEKYCFYINDLIFKIKNENIESSLDYLAYKYDISTKFNPSIILETDKLINDYEGLNAKKNKRKIYTFDNLETKDRDDGISITYLDGTYLLGVHISDPLYFFNKNNVILKEAEKRKTTIYMKDHNLNMFPDNLAENLISLNNDHYTPVRSYYFKIDALSGNLISFTYKKQIVKAHRNLTYDDLNKALKNKGDEELIIIASYLEKINEFLKNEYIIDPTYSDINRSQNNVSDTNIVGTTTAEKIIENIMVFTNKMVARYYISHDLPFIYRNHVLDKSINKEIERLKRMLNNEQDKKQYYKILNIIKTMYPKAYNGTSNKGHFGLGIEAYTHITSPIRRYEDVLANLMQDYLMHENIKNIEKLTEKMEAKCEDINYKVSSIELFQRDYHYQKKLEKRTTWD